MCGRDGTALALGSLVIVDMYNRDGEFTHSFSAYAEVVIELENVKTGRRTISYRLLTVGGQDNYTDFLLEEY